MSEPSFLGVARAFSAEDCSRIQSFLVRSSGLDDAEREVIVRSATEALSQEAHLALVRVLVLELHAARLTGSLGEGADPAAQFRLFVGRAVEPAFAEHLRCRYPVLDKRLRMALANRRVAIEALVSRMIEDRARLQRFFRLESDRLTGLELGLGDAHSGGAAVAKLGFAGRSVMYKPRPMALDVAFDGFLKNVFGECAMRIRIPAALDRGDYGWAAFVVHAHCADGMELAQFYRNMGRWIAILHLLGGTDVHCDNLVASGPVPVVVDPECLFARPDGPVESPQGAAHGEAARAIASSVLRTCMLPYRLPHLAFKGLDISSMGATAGRRPEVMAPTLVDEGTADARIAKRPIELEAPRSMPSPEPCFVEYGEEVAEGFTQTTRKLRDLDQAGELSLLLRAFEGCTVRDMRRTTQFYVELRHMLWHPASLHDPARARAQAMEKLEGSADLTADQIVAELSDLEIRDVPAFRSMVTAERIDQTLDRWRSDEPARQEMILRGSLVAAARNLRDEEQGERPQCQGPGTVDRSLGDHEPIRRELASRAVRRLIGQAVRATDGSLTWLGVTLGTNGWVLEPVGPDMYGGLAGIALALAGYRNEMRCGRVEPVAGLQEALEGCLTAARAMERGSAICRTGGFIGMGARIWQWLVLHVLLDRSELRGVAVEHAERLIAPGSAEDEGTDLLSGEAGLIVPLLNLGAATGDARWLDKAAAIGHRLERAAITDACGARWRGTSPGEPIGGFAHGATGIGWALARLSISDAGTARERGRWSEAADAAFRFERSLYDPALDAWRDLRMQEPDICAHAWCHGSIGIGLAAADLYARTGRDIHARTMRMAVTSALKHGWRNDVSLCHGSLGLRELVLRGSRLDDRFAAALPQGDGIILSEIGRRLRGAEPMAMELFVPGLMTGLSGMVLELCRMHPESRLPTPLLMEIEPSQG